MIRAITANNLFEKSNTREVNAQSDSNGLSAARVLDAISDDKSWALFNAIAISSLSDSNGQESRDGGQLLISCMNLTRRQYYQRINRLKSMGLIYRKKGQYRLSSFGMILYEIQKTIETAIQYRWKFVAIDSLVSSPRAEEMSAEDRNRIINLLLEDRDEIKNILLCNTRVSGRL